MNKKQNREYDAPKVELIEARVEKGFQASGLNGRNTELVGDSHHNYGNALFN